MTRFAFAVTLAAILAAAAATVLPRQPHAANHKIFKTFDIESIALSGEHSEVSGLFAQAIHSAAGQNNLEMVPIGDDTKFHYNQTNGEIYRFLGAKGYSYKYVLSVATVRTDTPRLTAGYKDVNFCIGGCTGARAFAIDADTKALTPNPPPKGFNNFAVCNVKFISDDEPKSSYQQLVWQHGPSAAGCTPVVLRITNLYGTESGG